MTVHGYIGLGMMGSAMCERLATSGATVLAHDLNTAAVDAAVEHGATAASSTEEVAEQANIISTCVPAAAHIDAVIDELATVGRAGQILLIHSTVHPDTIRAAQTRVAAWEGRVFDAAGAGGDAAAGSLAKKRHALSQHASTTRGPSVVSGASKKPGHCCAKRCPWRPCKTMSQPCGRLSRKIS